MNRSVLLRRRDGIEEVEMRGISLLLLGAMLASCTTAPPPPGAEMRSPRAQQEYASLTAGKVARPEVSCLPDYNANDMGVIDGRTLSFRRGTGTVYMMHLTPGCEMVSGGTYALLSRQYGGMGLCRGDIQQVIDTMNRITVGSCTIGAIVPYTRP
jgi:hypothetical protein